MPDQFYYTHCTSATSMTGEAEYRIRAASLPAQEVRLLVQAVASVGQYDLPLDMRSAFLNSSSLGPGEAPLRLARLKLNDGRTAVVQSAYRPKDAVGGSRSFFSHVLLSRPDGIALSALDAICLWGSRGAWGSPCELVWEDQTHLTGEAQHLPPWQFQHQSRFLTPHVVVDFLRGVAPPAPPLSCLEIIPRRVLGDSRRADRRAILEFAITAYLSGRRIYLAAEPGLAALVIYGLLKSLPPGVTKDLTFSTYEPDHSTSYRSSDARIVNTFWAEKPAAKFSVESFPPDAVALNALAPALDSTRFAPVSEPIAAYARFVLDCFERDDLAAIQQRWDDLSRLAKTEFLQVDALLQAWDTMRWIDEMDTRPPTPDKLEAALAHLAWRQRIFRARAGPLRVLELVTAERQPPSWWPKNAADTTALGEFTPVRDLPSLLVDYIARYATDPKTHDRADYCLAQLLLPLMGADSPLRLAMERVLDRLAGPPAAARPPDQVPFAARQWFLSCLWRSGLGDAPLALRCRGWLQVDREDELEGVCAIPALPEEWKAQSIAAFLNRSPAPSARATAILLCSAPLFKALLQSRRDTVPAFGDLPAILHRVAQGAGPGQDPARILLLLLESGKGLLPEDVFRSSCLAVIRQMVLFPSADQTPWAEIFAKNESCLPWLLSIADDEPGLADRICAGCADSLSQSCLTLGHPSQRLLVALVNHLLKSPHHPWPPECEASRQRLRQWLTVAAASGRLPFEFRYDWQQLPPAIKSLGLKDATGDLLPAMLAQAIKLGPLRAQVPKLLECAKLLADDQGNGEQALRKLLDASANFPDNLAQEFVKAIACHLGNSAAAKKFRKVVRRARPDLAAALASSRVTAPGTPPAAAPKIASPAIRAPAERTAGSTGTNGFSFRLLFCTVAATAVIGSVFGFWLGRQFPESSPEVGQEHFSPSAEDHIPAPQTVAAASPEPTPTAQPRKVTPVVNPESVGPSSERSPAAENPTPMPVFDDRQVAVYVTDKSNHAIKLVEMVGERLPMRGKDCFTVFGARDMPVERSLKQNEFYVWRKKPDSALVVPADSEFIEDLFKRPGFPAIVSYIPDSHSDSGLKLPDSCHDLKLPNSYYHGMADSTPILFVPYPNLASKGIILVKEALPLSPRFAEADIQPDGSLRVALRQVSYIKGQPKDPELILTLDPKMVEFSKVQNRMSTHIDDRNDALRRISRTPSVPTPVLMSTNGTDIWAGFLQFVADNTLIIIPALPPEPSPTGIGTVKPDGKASGGTSPEKKPAAGNAATGGKTVGTTAASQSPNASAVGGRKDPPPRDSSKTK
jgi:hypothetical protein